MKSICGINCDECPMKAQCKGCEATDGHPFGGSCVTCEAIKCGGNQMLLERKQSLIKEFRALGIKELENLNDLCALAGFYVNLEYPLINGNKIKLINDNDIYLGYQVEKENSERCYGLITDGKMLIVAEYGCNGADPELIIYKKLA